MAPASRMSLGVELANEASAFVAPLPAPGTPPDVFLAALISERREREYLHMTAAAQRAAEVRGQLQRHGVKN